MIKLQKWWNDEASKKREELNAKNSQRVIIVQLFAR